jgi:hypothetical protein
VSGSGRQDSEGEALARQALASQTDHGDTKPVKIKAGDVRGLLTALRLVTVEHRRGEIWLYRCACGAFLSRPTTWVNKQVRDGRTPACPACGEDIHAGKLDAVEAHRYHAMLDLWEEHHTLYPSMWADIVTRVVKDELVEEFGPMIEPVDMADWGTPMSKLKQHETDATNQQRMWYLFPVGNDSLDEVWTCMHCQSPTWRCFECVQCEQAVCVECARRERHRHLDPDLVTLQQMVDSGEFLDKDMKISTTRIQQIANQAFRKLRHPRRMHMFADWLMDHFEKGSQNEGPMGPTCGICGLLLGLYEHDEEICLERLPALPTR